MVEGLNPHARMTSTWLPIAMCGPVHHNSSAQSSAASDATGKLLISSSVLARVVVGARHATTELPGPGPSRIA